MYHQLPKIKHVVSAKCEAQTSYQSFFGRVVLAFCVAVRMLRHPYTIVITSDYSAADPLTTHVVDIDCLGYEKAEDACRHLACCLDTMSDLQVQTQFMEEVKTIIQS